MTFGLHFGMIHIYVSTVRMKRRGKSDTIYLKYRHKLRKVKKQRYVNTGGICEKCGKAFKADKLEIHHVESVTTHPELATSYKNIRLLCHECHVDLHRKQRAEQLASERGW